MTSRLYRSTVSQWYEEAVQEVERDLSLDISHLERVGHPIIRIMLIVRLVILILLIVRLVIRILHIDLLVIRILLIDRLVIRILLIVHLVIL